MARFNGTERCLTCKRLAAELAERGECSVLDVGGRRGGQSAHIERQAGMHLTERQSNLSAHDDGDDDSGSSNNNKQQQTR
jgi:hypothetical protein